MRGRMVGKTVAITGASRGLGRSLALAFADEGANLVLGARTAGEIDELAALIGTAVAVATDVRSPEECRRLVEAAEGEFGGLDVVIANAGVAIYGPVESYNEDDVNAILDTNVKGTIYTCQAAFAAMKRRRRGHIVAISSIAGKLHLVNESVYGASKWAVNGYMGVLRQEAELWGIRVTTVCPGGIDTPFWKEQEFLPFPEHVDPARDFLKPEDVAATVVRVVTNADRVCETEVVMLPMLPKPGAPS